MIYSLSRGSSLSGLRGRFRLRPNKPDPDNAGVGRECLCNNSPLPSEGAVSCTAPAKIRKKKGSGQMSMYRGVAITVAGSDSGGGAGIQADLKTFAALRVFGTSAITAITVQNSLGVSGVQVIPPEIIEAQIVAVGSDFSIGAVKTGMVGNREAVDAVVSGIRKISTPFVVVDPVMIAQSGDPLIEDNAVAAVRDCLIPLATIVTPNLPEAERLTCMDIKSVEDMKKAAYELKRLGCGAVLVKGGHLESGDMVSDVLLVGSEVTVFEDSRISTNANHGTGCTLSSAIAAELASGCGLTEAVSRARRYLREGLTRGVTLGHGAGCLGHAVRMEWVD